MAATDVLVLNLGADRQFKYAVRHVTGVVQSIAVTKQAADVQVATSRSRARIAELLGDPMDAGSAAPIGRRSPGRSVSASRSACRSAEASSTSRPTIVPSRQSSATTAWIPSGGCSYVS